MPRITIEFRKPVAEYIAEITSKDYDLPDRILYNGKIMNWDSYHQLYTDPAGVFTVSGKDYVKEQLSLQKKLRAANDGPEM